MVGRLSRRGALLLGLGSLVPVACRSEERETERVRAAVASNFAEAVAEIARAFARQGGAAVEVSTGSTGKLAAQIANGAPFHVLLAADDERPRQLEADGHAVAGTRFTYAIGRLALYGPGLEHPDDGLVDLRAARFEHLALANPSSAPYGRAAKQVLERLGLWGSLAPRVARGENVAQALHFVDAGGAELGFVALGSVLGSARYRHFTVPADLHDPIRQDAVLLQPGRDVAAARALLDFLRGPEARQVIARSGYSVEGP